MKRVLRRSGATDESDPHGHRTTGSIATGRTRRACAGRWLCTGVLVLWPLLGGAGQPPSLQGLQSHDTAIGRFTQKRYLPDLERAIVGRGRFAFDAERGLLWRVREPVESTLVINADGVYQDGEKAAGGRALKALRPIFSTVFGGDTHALKQRFRVTRESVGDAWRLRLLPRGGAAAAALDGIVITGSDEPERVMIRTADGGRTELSFHDLDHPDSLPAQQREVLQRGG